MAQSKNGYDIKFESFDGTTEEWIYWFERRNVAFRNNGVKQDNKKRDILIGSSSENMVKSISQENNCFLKCNQCKFAANRDNRLRARYMHNHPDEPKTLISTQTKKKCFKCTKCSFTTKTCKQLKKHILLSHTINKFYKCTECAYSTRSLDQLKKHKVVHIVNEQYTCSECISANESNRFKVLKKYLISYTGNQCYNCITLRNNKNAPLTKQNISENPGKIVKSNSAGSISYNSSENDKLYPKYLVNPESAQQSSDLETFTSNKTTYNYIHPTDFGMPKTYQRLLEGDTTGYKKRASKEIISITLEMIVEHYKLKKKLAYDIFSTLNSSMNTYEPGYHGLPSMTLNNNTDLVNVPDVESNFNENEIKAHAEKVTYSNIGMQVLHPSATKLVKIYLEKMKSQRKTLNDDGKLWAVDNANKAEELIKPLKCRSVRAFKPQLKHTELEREIALKQLSEITQRRKKEKTKKR